MNLLLCMAGLYRRFRDAGYTTPKYLLPFEGRPTLAHVLDLATSPHIDQCYLVANQRDEAFRPEIEALLAHVGIPKDHLVYVGDTIGQAQTAQIGIEHFHLHQPDAPVLVHNIDTILRGRDFGRIKTALSTHAGVIDVFDNDGPQYSYVALNPQGRVVQIAEKQPISRHATTGLYGFASAQAFLDALKSAHMSKGELYVSDVYAQMLQQGLPLTAWPQQPQDQTIVLGTPAEYEAAIS